MRKGVEANNRHPHLKEKHFCPIEGKKAPGERLQHMQERLTWRWVVLPDWSTSLFNCLTWIEHKKWLKPSSYLPIVLSDHLMQCIYHTNASPYTTVSLKSNPHAERSRSQQPTSSFERETLLPYRSEESTWGEVAAHARALDVLPDWSTSLFNCLTFFIPLSWQFYLVLTLTPLWFEANCRDILNTWTSHWPAAGPACRTVLHEVYVKKLFCNLQLERR